ncbi:MAG: C1 family peptidase [Bacteroidota bacterium]|nr:C1 family peptidase [Bacteroidota bacterium]
MIRFLIVNVFIVSYLCNGALAQDKKKGYQFTNVNILAAPPVKNQGSTSTCWVFSTLGMLESEMMRNGKTATDLSEMFIVHEAYKPKAEKYVQLHGNLSFSGGGEYNDVMNVIKESGIVPREVYAKMIVKNGHLDNNDMDNLLKNYVDSLAKTPDEKILCKDWKPGLDKILDTCLGEIPQNFNYSGKEFTPKSFATYLGINPDDYILVTSYTHHPFYEKFVLEVPDNWSWGQYYNVPLDELETIIDTALYKNYTLTWAADVSEKGFSFSKGIAVVPDLADQDTCKEHWERALTTPGAETTITQSLRQLQFDDYATTDDHGMQIIGTAKDQNNTKYYYVRNSWGTDNPYNGYIYASEAYVRLKTMSVMVNKHALPLYIQTKLKI